ncbi:MAG: tRNA glutamyl-Q(34) synthetase GluQRS [Gammaproteobacteria bacterium RBG_16_57_12]|nr:MAG: tRNA glutamyl-Q(34) synthetase GluQRS [Gammaproteobacteria bacterium RBG_16_57_12]
MQKQTYRGRFAPSPTGPLHFGSLIAALGSFLQAKQAHGTWLLRIEDIDPPREIPGAADDILYTLESYGLEWDEQPLYQSTRSEAYREALLILERMQRIYLCGCSRKEITDAAQPGEKHAIYPGTCRNRLPAGKSARALRLNTQGIQIRFADRLQGEIKHDLERETGDFVIRRADGPIAYQLAVVIDDAAQGITEVVRGSDLLEQTPGQLYLQQLLDLKTPDYLHLPVATHQHGQKLSKQTFARALDTSQPIPALIKALDFLGQSPPPELHEANLAEFWHWAISHWDSRHIPNTRTIAIAEQT